MGLFLHTYLVNFEEIFLEFNLAFGQKSSGGWHQTIGERRDKVLGLTFFGAPFFFWGGRGGNASCTVTPFGAVCGTPAWLAVGSKLPVGLSAA